MRSPYPSPSLKNVAAGPGVQRCGAAPRLVLEALPHRRDHVRVVHEGSPREMMIPRVHVCVDDAVAGQLRQRSLRRPQLVAWRALAACRAAGIHPGEPGGVERVGASSALHQEDLLQPNRAQLGRGDVHLMHPRRVVQLRGCKVAERQLNEHGVQAAADVGHEAPHSLVLEKEDHAGVDAQRVVEPGAIRLRRMLARDVPIAAHNSSRQGRQRCRAGRRSWRVRIRSGVIGRQSWRMEGCSAEAVVLRDGVDALQDVQLLLFHKRQVHLRDGAVVPVARRVAADAGCAAHLVQKHHSILACELSEHSHVIATVGRFFRAVNKDHVALDPARAECRHSLCRVANDKLKAPRV